MAADTETPRTGLARLLAGLGVLPSPLPSPTESELQHTVLATQQEGEALAAQEATTLPERPAGKAQPALPQQRERSRSRRRSGLKVIAPFASPRSAREQGQEEMTDDPVIRDWARDMEGVQWGLGSWAEVPGFQRFPPPTTDLGRIGRYLEEMEGRVLQDGGGVERG